MLWLGNGARTAGPGARALMALGFGIVSSWNGRGIVAGDDPQTLGAMQGNVDFASGSLDALPDIASAVGCRAEILLDDVVKAVALGARAVLVGRPHLYGLAVNGRQGVESILGILRREMMGTMQLMGADSMAQLDSGWVKPRAGHPHPVRR
jgi:isopentenyl diphosphate isomerase/L-lactate dehydrogenase-like FMN-dependent dehydrogenase